MGMAHWYLQGRLTQNEDYSVVLDQSRYMALIASRLAELYTAEPVFCALLSMMVLAYIWKKVKLVLHGSIHGLKRS